jgi:hypothetical protein
MAFDVEGAKQAGYSDAEINSYLAKESNFDLRGARRAGYKDDEILKHLISAAPPKQKEPPPVEPSKIEPTPEGQSVLRQIADVPLKIGAGAVTGVRMIADAFGAESGVSKTLRGVEDEIAALYSAQSKKDSKEIARIMKEAEDKGVMDQVIAGVKAMSVAPVDRCCQRTWNCSSCYCCWFGNACYWRYAAGRRGSNAWYWRNNGRGYC